MLDRVNLEGFKTCLLFKLFDGFGIFGCQPKGAVEGADRSDAFGCLLVEVKLVASRTEPISLGWLDINGCDPRQRGRKRVITRGYTCVRLHLCLNGLCKGEGDITIG